MYNNTNDAFDGFHSAWVKEGKRRGKLCKYRVDAWGKSVLVVQVGTASKVRVPARQFSATTYTVRNLWSFLNMKKEILKLSFYNDYLNNVVHQRYNQSYYVIVDIVERFTQNLMYCSCQSRTMLQSVSLENKNSATYWQSLLIYLPNFWHFAEKC